MLAEALVQTRGCSPSEARTLTKTLEEAILAGSDKTASDERCVPALALTFSVGRGVGRGTAMGDGDVVGSSAGRDDSHSQPSVRNVAARTSDWSQHAISTLVLAHGSTRVYSPAS